MKRIFLFGLMLVFSMSNNIYAGDDNPDGPSEALQKCGNSTYRYNYSMQTMWCWGEKELELGDEIKMDCREDPGMCCDPQMIDTSNCHCEYDYWELILNFGQAIVEAILAAGGSLCSLLPMLPK